MTVDGHYIIAVDFDGTLMTGNKWPDVNGQMNKHLVTYLIREQMNGNKIILDTCRSGEPLDKAVEICEANGLKFDAINANLPELIEAYGNDSRKISADIYIDDRSCHPESVSWSFFNTYAKSITEHPLYRKGGENE